MSRTNTIFIRDSMFTLESTVILFFVSIFVVSFAACKPAPQPAAGKSAKTKQQAKQVANTKFRHDPWQATNVKLFQTDGQNPVDVSAQTTIYRYGTGSDDIPVYVVAFKIPGTNQSWIGPEQDAYLKSDKQVVGTSFDGDRTLLFWLPSMYQPSQATSPSQTSLSEDIAAFDSSIDVETLWDAAFQMEIKAVFVTDIESAIGSDFFVVGSTIGEMKTTSIVVENNCLKFRIENLTTEATADVWVDMVSRDVVKATKNGTQVFPVLKTAPSGGDLQRRLTNRKQLARHPQLNQAKLPSLALPSE